MKTSKNRFCSTITSAVCLGLLVATNHVAADRRELYNNVVILDIVDLLQRRQHEPGVREILSAIRRGTPTDTGFTASDNS